MFIHSSKVSDSTKYQIVNVVFIRVSYNQKEAYQNKTKESDVY